jgi:hypothetical protein
MGELLEPGAPFPSVAEFEEDATALNELTTELGCDPEEIRDDVKDRAGELTSESDLGRFLIESLRTGSL